MTDLISRADAIAYIDKIINSGLGRNKSLNYIHKYISSLPSADAVNREQYDYVCEEYNRLVHKAVCVNLCDENCEYEKGRTCYHAREHYAVDSVVSADAVQGEWIWRTDIPIGDGRTSAGYICSNCGKDYWHGNVFNYCPSCGAIMKGGAE